MFLGKTLPVTFRDDDAQAGIEVLIKWCKDNNRSVNAVFNAIMPAISFCVQNYTRVDAEGNVTIELNLGNIKILPTKNPWQNKRKNPQP